MDDIKSLVEIAEFIEDISTNRIQSPTPDYAIRFYVKIMTVGGEILLNVFNYVVILTAYWSISSFDALIYVIFMSIPIAPSVEIGYLEELREALLSENGALCETRNRLIQIVWMHNKQIQ